ncbi:MAG: chaperone modulator CbpM [Caldimonas sp.]
MEQLAQLSGVAMDELAGLKEFGVLAETRPEHGPTTFDIGFVMTLQRAQKLRQDLALDEHSFALAVMFLQHVADLEEEVRIVRSEASRLLDEPNPTPTPVPRFAQSSATHSER